MDLKVYLIGSSDFLTPQKPQMSKNQGLKMLFIFSALKKWMLENTVMHELFPSCLMP